MSKRIGTRFTPLRVGILGHHPRFAKRPEAYLVWMELLVRAPRSGPDTGRARVNKQELAQRFGWSYNRVSRAIRWLTENPKSEKPYLVRLTTDGQRGASVEYYIRNFEGGDPSLDQGTSHRSPADDGNAVPIVHPRTNCPQKRSSAPSFTGGRTRPKVRSPHRSPADDVETYMARARRRLEEEDEERSLTMEDRTKSKNPESADEATAEQFRITRIFESEKDLERFFRFELFGGMPEHMIDEAVRRAMRQPQAYGCGLREPDDDQDAIDNIVELKQPEPDEVPTDAYEGETETDEDPEAWEMPF